MAKPENDARAFEMRSGGMTYREIGGALGVSETRARNACKREERRIGQMIAASSYPAFLQLSRGTRWALFMAGFADWLIFNARGVRHFQPFERHPTSCSIPGLDRVQISECLVRLLEEFDAGCLGEYPNHGRPLATHSYAGAKVARELRDFCGLDMLRMYPRLDGFLSVDQVN